jgi:hypothetical protein
MHFPKHEKIGANCASARTHTCTHASTHACTDTRTDARTHPVGVSEVARTISELVDHASSPQCSVMSDENM